MSTKRASTPRINKMQDVIDKPSLKSKKQKSLSDMSNCVDKQVRKQSIPPLIFVGSGSSCPASPKPATLRKQTNLKSMVFNSVILIALQDHTGDGEEELSFSKGETIYFLEKDDNEWVRGSKEDGTTGWFDKRFVKFISGRIDPLITPTASPTISRSPRQKAKTKTTLNNFLADRPTKKQLRDKNVLLPSETKPTAKKNTDFLTKFFQKKFQSKFTPFGRPLSVLTSEDNPIPSVISQIIEYLREIEGL